MYTTLDRAKSEIKTGSTANAAEDAYILRLLGYVSRRVQSFAGAVNIDFEPRYDTRRFDATPDRINTLKRTFLLKDHLLEADTITVDGVAKAWTTDILPYPQNRLPYSVLRLVSTSASWYPSGLGSSCDIFDPYEKIVIAGWWGYREWSTGWLLSTDTVQNNPLTAGGASITVTDADGADSLSRTPRFSPGNLLRIEDEMCEVYAVNTGTNVLSVFRGARGTTAAQHVQGTAIQIWEPEEDIQRLAARWTAQLYARKGAFEQAQIGDLATVTFPADATVEILAALQRYAYA